ELLEPWNLIIDCTGSDDALRRLAQVRWTSPRTFVSASFDVGARRTFIFIAHAYQFPFQEFASKVAPMLVRIPAGTLLESQQDLVTPGCWSPSFPARCDDVWLAAVAAVKHTVSVVDRGLDIDHWILRAYEQSGASDDFVGIRLLSEDEGAL